MAIDFEDLKRRLTEAQDDAIVEVTAEILRERARTLAGRALVDSERRTIGQLVVVRRARSHIGVPIESVRELRLVRVTRLVTSNRAIIGIFQVRGQVHSLVDLSAIAGDAEPLDSDGHTHAMILTHGGRDLGLRVDEVIGPRTVFEDELDDTARDRRLKFVAHVTRDVLEIIDLEALFASPDVRVNG